MSVNVCYIQVTDLTASAYKNILPKSFVLFPACFDERSRSASSLLSQSLTATCSHVVDQANHLCALELTIKDKAPRFIGFYAQRSCGVVFFFSLFFGDSNRSSQRHSS